MGLFKKSNKFVELQCNGQSEEDLRLYSKALSGSFSSYCTSIIALFALIIIGSRLFEFSDDQRQINWLLVAAFVLLIAEIANLKSRVNALTAILRNRQLLLPAAQKQTAHNKTAHSDAELSK